MIYFFFSITIKFSIQCIAAQNKNNIYFIDIFWYEIFVNVTHILPVVLPKFLYRLFTMNIKKYFQLLSFLYSIGSVRCWIDLCNLAYLKIDRRYCKRLWDEIKNSIQLVDISKWNNNWKYNLRASAIEFDNSTH